MQQNLREMLSLQRQIRGTIITSSNISLWKRTCSSMSPGSILPSAATAPPFMIEPM